MFYQRYDARDTCRWCRLADNLWRAGVAVGAALTRQIDTHNIGSDRGRLVDLRRRRETIS